MRTVTLRIKKDYAMKLLQDLEKSAAIALIPEKKKRAVRKKKLTKQEITDRALESEKAIREKKYSSLSALEKEMKNW